MSIRCGDTLLFQTPPVIAAGAAVGGKKRAKARWLQSSMN